MVIDHLINMIFSLLIIGVPLYIWVRIAWHQQSLKSDKEYAESNLRRAEQEIKNLKGNK